MTSPDDRGWLDVFIETCELELECADMIDNNERRNAEMNYWRNRLKTARAQRANITTTSGAV